MDAVGNRRIVRNEAVLRTFIVVRRHEEQCIRTDLLRILREFDRIGSLIRSCACNDGDAPLDLRDCKADGLAVLSIRHGRGFPRRAGDDDGIRPARNLILDDAPQLRVVDPRLRKRRNDGDACAAENCLFHCKFPFQIHLLLLSHAKGEKSK